MRKQSKTLSILLAVSLTLGSALPSSSLTIAAENTDTASTAAITVTPDPSLGTPDTGKDLAHLAFTTQTQDGTKTTNISANNYLYTAAIRNSYLEQTEDGGFLRMEFNGVSFWVEKYSSDLKEVSKITRIRFPLSKFGGYFKGKDARYIVCGEDNKDELEDKEVIRIIKYDMDWNELNHVSVYGANTQYPFHAGDVDMTEMDGTLYIHASHNMFKSEDGINHQANMSFAVNEETMEILTQHTNVSHNGKGGHGYVSHSFCQHIEQDGGNIYLLDHGDGYPRSVRLQKIDSGLQKVSKVLDILKIDGKIGENATGVSVGNLAISGDHLFMAGNSVEQFGELFKPAGSQRNLWVSIANKDMDSEPVFVWLTDYKKDGIWNANTPYVVPASDGNCYVIWENPYQTQEDDGTFLYTNKYYTLTKIAKIQPDGTIDGKIHTIYGNLSDCQPIITSDNQLVWYTTNSSSPLFYTLDLEKLDSYEFNGFPDIRKCTVTLASDSYTYDQKAKPHPSSGPAVTSISYGDYQLQKGVDYTLYYSDNSQPGTGYVNIIPKGFFSDPTQIVHEKLKIPFQVIYPENTPTPTIKPTAVPVISETPVPEKTPYREPGWFRSPSPGETKKPSAPGVPDSSKSPAAPNSGATKKPVVKTTAVPNKTTAPSTDQTQKTTSSRKKLSKVKNVKAVNLSSKKLQITWKLQTDANGYQIQYAQNKKFTKNKKSASVSNYRSYKIISGLKKGKIYYVRVRSYQKQTSGKIYGKWSKVVKCQIKK